MFVSMFVYLLPLFLRFAYLYNIVYNKFMAEA